MILPALTSLAGIFIALFANALRRDLRVNRRVTRDKSFWLPGHSRRR